MVEPALSSIFNKPVPTTISPDTLSVDEPTKTRLEISISGSETDSGQQLSYTPDINIIKLSVSDRFDASNPNHLKLNPDIAQDVTELVFHLARRNQLPNEVHCLASGDITAKQLLQRVCFLLMKCMASHYASFPLSIIWQDVDAVTGRLLASQLQPGQRQSPHQIRNVSHSNLPSLVDYLASVDASETPTLSLWLSRTPDDALLAQLSQYDQCCFVINLLPVNSPDFGEIVLPANVQQAKNTVFNDENATGVLIVDSVCDGHCQVDLAALKTMQLQWSKVIDVLHQTNQLIMVRR